MTASVRPAEVGLFCEFLAQETGWQFSDKKDALEKVLRRRVQCTKSPSVLHYLRSIAPARQELAVLANDLTVSETYFFRDRGQFEALGAILSGWSERRNKNLRVLSAGCSSGDEPYSLSIAIRERLQNWTDWTISIRAVDLNRAIVDKAKTAHYRKWALRETPPETQDAYFREDGDTYILDQEIAASVQFYCDNLARPIQSFWNEETFDLIFCRNVLMYLTPEIAREVVARFSRMLNPGGFLFLGHAETLRGLSNDFLLRQSHGAFYYQPRAPARRRPRLTAASPPEPLPLPSRKVEEANDRSWFATISRSSSRIQELSQVALKEENHEAKIGDLAPRPMQAVEDAPLHIALNLIKLEKFQEALEIVEKRSLPALKDPNLDLAHAMLLVCTGKVQEALALCEKLLHDNESNAGVRYILSICHDYLGDHKLSAHHSRAACSLDSGFAMPRLQLGRLARRSRNYPAATKELHVAVELLTQEHAQRILLFGGGFSRESLLEICRAELRACGDVR